VLKNMAKIKLRRQNVLKIDLEIHRKIPPDYQQKPM
jgi:hypothetical protein